MSKKILILMIAGLGLMTLGCAPNYVGTYTGTETVSQNGTSSAVPITLSITSDTNNQVSGNVSGTSGTATISGMANGYSLQNVSMMVANTAPNYSYGATPQVNVCAGNYQGNLSLANGNHLTGSLTSMANTGTQGGMSYCNGTIAIDVTHN